jgi:hypothetical protein
MLTDKAVETGNIVSVVFLPWRSPLLSFRGIIPYYHGTLALKA